MANTAETLIMPQVDTYQATPAPPPQQVPPKKKSMKWILIITAVILTITLPVIVYFIFQYQQSTETRSKATGGVCKPYPGSSGYCVTGANCAGRSNEDACMNTGGEGGGSDGCCIWDTSGGGGGGGGGGTSQRPEPPATAICNGMSCPLARTSTEGGTGCTSWASGWSSCETGKPGEPYEYLKSISCISNDAIIAYAEYACLSGNNNTPTEVPNTPTDVPDNTPTVVPDSTPTDVPDNTPTDVPDSTPTDVSDNTPTDVPGATDTPTPTEEVLADNGQINDAEPTESVIGQDVPTTGVGPGFVATLTIIGSVLLLILGLAL